MIAALRLLPYLISGGAVFLLWIAWQANNAKAERIDLLERELRVQTMIADQSQEARRVAAAEAERQRGKAEEYDRLKETLLRGEEDAPLPDWFRVYLGRLFAAN